MGKHHAFDSMLESPFRWPREGDTAFVSSVDWSQNAYLEAEESLRLSSMTEGYRTAADLMVDRALEDEIDRNLLVCPIIFSYRQFLELSLKGLIQNYGMHVAVDPIWDTHRLEVLWKHFSEMLDRFGTIDPDLADAYVESVIAEFAKMDPNSFSHRYPVDTKGRPLPLSVEALDLSNLKDVMTGVAGYFSGCDGFLDALRSAAE